MKKTFQLTVSNKTPDRQVDSIRHEVNKYIARERRKTLPDNVDFWDFNCRIGENEEKAVDIHHSAISAKVGELSSEKRESFYLEILAKPGHRAK